MSDFDAEREANIARNRALLAQLDISIAKLDIPPSAAPKQKGKAKAKAKPIQKARPVQPARKPKPQVQGPVRQSARLRKTIIDPNETSSNKRKREAEEETQRKKEEEERLEAEEKAREAKRPRHHDLEISTLAEHMDAAEVNSLMSGFKVVTASSHSSRGASHDAFILDDKEKSVVTDLKKKLHGMKVVARAKVTQNRVYSSAYHPEVTKDLIFFGDKNGQLGIWDARAPAEEVTDEDDEAPTSNEQESGRYWRLQLHWPATPKSSISAIKFDPTNHHSLFTSAYDCTVRSLDFTSGVSREIFSSHDDALINCIDLPPTGNEMWISDALGGVTHLDLREDKSKAKWYQLSHQKIGSVSVNPVDPHFLLTASNSRLLRVWDTRKLTTLSAKSKRTQFDTDRIESYITSDAGKSCRRLEWRHDKSVSSAYWDPRGRGIVSTSYDDTIRLWDIKPSLLSTDAPFPSSRPISEIRHNCQTGKWLTVLKAQWSQNPDAYPHFTIGNMNHSLDIFGCKGDLLARLSDKSLITAVQAVTCSHPRILERAASGNASGRCILWAPPEEE